MTEQHQPAATAELRTDLLLGGFRIIDVASCMAAAGGGDALGKIAALTAAGPGVDLEA